MARINKTKYALLGALRMNPGSGYDIKKFCDFSIAHFWNENYGHIYPVLKQLEDEGLATKETEYTEGKPARNVYSITDKGRQELREWLMRPVEEQPLRSELLLKLFFSGDIPLEDVREKIQHHRAKHQKQLEIYDRIEGMLRSEKDLQSHRLLPLWLSTVSCGKYDSLATINWCVETLKTIDEMIQNDRSKNDE